MTEEKPSFMKKVSDYIKKNQAAEAERRKRTGEPSFGEEMSNFGASWAKGISDGMAKVGESEEAKLSGRSREAKIVDDEDDFSSEILFGSSAKKKQPSSSSGGTGHRSAYTEQEFIDKLCEFLRFVNEDDDVELYQKRGNQTTKVDYKYLGKLLTRHFGHKITLKERDLSIK